MDLAQKGTRVKRELQSAVHQPAETSVRHALEAFDAFVDGVVEEISQTKAALKNGSEPAETDCEDRTESVIPATTSPESPPSASPPVSRRSRECHATGRFRGHQRARCLLFGFPSSSRTGFQNCSSSFHCAKGYSPLRQFLR